MATKMDKLVAAIKDIVVSGEGFGEKAFISDAAAAAGLTLEDAKELALYSHTWGHRVRLSRCDMPQLHSKSTITASALQDDNALYHLVELVDR